MENKSFCIYPRCKKVKQVESPFGSYCKYHFETLKKKFPNLKGQEVTKISNSIRKGLERFKNMKNVKIIIKEKEVRNHGKEKNN